ncbi:MAG: chlorite dismutase family protein [Chloroflexota bacterium]
MDTTYMQYLFYRLDPAWRRLPDKERHCRATELSEAIEAQSDITTYAYSMTGLKAGRDLMLWRSGGDLAAMQTAAAELQSTKLGTYLEIANSYIGLIGASTYTRRQQPQEQAAFSRDRSTFLVVYPFTKTMDWYFLSQQSRQGMMNEHIKIGHEYAHIRQVLVYSTGLDDQEFIVSYETDDLAEFQSLVKDLRPVDSRKYTQADTPIYTCLHRPLKQALELLG